MNKVSFGSTYRTEPFHVLMHSMNDDLGKKMKIEEFAKKNDIKVNSSIDESNRFRIIYSHAFVVPDDKDKMFESYCMQNKIYFNKIEK